MNVEIFKPVIFRGNLIKGYEVSNKGRVKSLERKIEYETTNQTGKKFLYKKVLPCKILKPKKDRGGYLYVQIPIESGKYKSVKIHRLVAETFIPNQKNLKNVNHKDENKTNNCVENLEWCTTAYNNSYGSRGEKMHKIKVFEDGKEILYFHSLREASKKTGLDRKTIMKFVNNEPQVFRRNGKNAQYKNCTFLLC